MVLLFKGLAFRFLALAALAGKSRVDVRSGLLVSRCVQGETIVAFVCEHLPVLLLFSGSGFAGFWLWLLSQARVVWTSGLASWSVAVSWVRPLVH